MRAEEAPWERLLSDATESVMGKISKLASSGDRSQVLGLGASGDKTLLADKEAEDEILRALSRVDDLWVFSEEAGAEGERKGRWTAIVDPLDGSSNFERGIPFYCSSVAVSKGGDLADVTFGLIRNLVNGDVYAAGKGRGSTVNGKRLTPSRQSEPRDSVVDIDLSKASTALLSRLAPVVGAVKRQVHFGANALELCLVAEGKLDAFVDLRDRMRVTDFAAAYLITKEAGVVVTDPNGGELHPKFDFADRFSFVASGNPALHERILDLCGGAALGRE